MKLANASGQVNNRRKQALLRLEEQLKLGTKTEKIAQITLVTTSANQIPLEENDIKRIKSEINTLKNVIISDESARNIRHKKFRGTR